MRPEKGTFAYRGGQESVRAHPVRESALFRATPPACPLQHDDLGRLNRDYASRLRSTYLHPAELGPAQAGPTHSPALRCSSPPARPAQTRRWGQSGGAVRSDDPTDTPDRDPEPRLICARCRSPIRRNPTLRISFCEVCGLSQGFIELRPGQRSLPLYPVQPFPVPPPAAPALRPVPSRPGSGPVVRPSRPPVPAPSAPATGAPPRQSGPVQRSQPGLNPCPRTRVPTRVHAEGGP